MRVMEVLRAAGLRPVVYRVRRAGGSRLWTTDSVGWQGMRVWAAAAFVCCRAGACAAPLIQCRPGEFLTRLSSRSPPL